MKQVVINKSAAKLFVLNCGVIGGRGPLFVICVLRSDWSRPGGLRTVGQDHRSHFIIISNSNKAAGASLLFLYTHVFIFRPRAHVAMGQCGITSSKTVLVFLNLIFWVRNERRREGDVWASSPARPGQLRQREGPCSLRSELTHQP